MANVYPSNSEYYELEYNAQLLLRKVKADFDINTISESSEFIETLNIFENDIKEKRVEQSTNIDYNYFKLLFEKETQIEPIIKQNQQMSFIQPIPTQIPKKPVTQGYEKLFNKYHKYLETLPTQWSQFLNCASSVYKYTFPNQVMIYGQFPNATAVATSDVWQKCNRQVIFNQPPIVSISQRKDTIKEKRLYDISQTQGADIYINHFEISKQEELSLLENFNSKYKISAKNTLSSIAKVTEQLIKLSVNPVLLKEHSKLIYNSAVYVIAQKLGYEIDVDFTKMRDITNLKTLVLVGESIQKTSQNMLGNLQKEIKLIRSMTNERENNIKRSEIHSNWGEPIPTSKRNNISTNNVRGRNTNNATDDRHNSNEGQLFFGQIRTDGKTIYGGKSREQTLGIDNGWNSDGTVTSEGGRTSRNEIQPNREYGKTISTSTNRRHNENSKSSNVDTNSSRGTTFRGNIQTSLSLSFSPKARFNDNITAITLLKKMESENRIATSEEREILSRYVGWGGLADVFNVNKPVWKVEFEQLESLLTDDEYAKARSSTLTAYYTEPAIIKAMYNGILNLGITGNIDILEPSMGVGNFFKMLPAELENADLHGVELDDLTGRIAQKIYPQSNIQINGYQETKFPDNHFDVVIGNVPFGEFKAHNDKHNLFIHDFFFAKALDELKPNGILAFITSKGTLDKANPKFRKYLAQRAELIGAIRLPDTAFKGIAGTEITSDIIFLRKREKEIIAEPNWVSTGFTDDKIPINQYYIDNPQNLMGKMVMESSRFGHSPVLKPFDNFDLYNGLNDAILNFTDNTTIEVENIKPLEIENVLPADPTVKNFTYTVINNNIYFRDKDAMTLYDGKQAERIKGMHYIRQSLREVINLQRENYNEDTLKQLQSKLNNVYDSYVKKYGDINSKINRKAFIEDIDLPLLLSIENIDGNENVTKTKIFTQATIKPKVIFQPKSYDDLITMSMTQLGKIDIDYMAKNFNTTSKDVIENLQGKIYLNPQNNKYEPADLYLSGNVKEKLDLATESFIENPDYDENVKALTLVQPTPLTAEDINFKLGSSFIDIKYYKQFMYELGETPFYLQEENGNQAKSRIILTYNQFTSEYTIYNKTATNNIKTSSAFGTERRNMYTIIEDCLNLHDSKVFDRVNIDGKDKNKLNIKETSAVKQKQELIRHEFKDWLFKDPERANDVIKTYNNLYNVFRPQVFDGSKLTFDGMNNDIDLRDHQKDAIARCLYSGKNVLLGHVVGAGKTYTMTAAAMELKRIGIANKSLFVVPNHLTEQWGSDFLKLYPSANILVAKKKDFEPLNRKQFIGKICTGEYDAIIIGHSQFQRIPMSDEFVKQELENQLKEINLALSQLESEDGSRSYSTKQLELERKKTEEKLTSIKLGLKDNVITFEETGIDYLFVDEAHNYKNCFVHTKMSNVAGVGTTNAQKSFDMLLKTKYISNKNDGKGVIFATGTPISNSMTELFVMQRYLQSDALAKANVSYFDQWASIFGETISALELKPEGTGYRMKTRFAKFHNLPELINMFTQVADIKVTADLNLPTPSIATGKPIIVVSPSSEFVKQYVDSLVVRAEDIRDGMVQPWDDNMLKVTGEGKAVAIDARLIDPTAEVERDSKVYKCCDNIFDLYNKYESDKALQLVFLDTGLPLYKIIKDDLINKGIPEDDIAFIHDAKTDDQKAKLFTRCRSGDIRVLIGSTQKMGAGTNVQDRLIANHHLDCPWRPADIEQRDGRILRQGNMFSEVYIYRYITENTFDAYLWGIQENKQKFITQIMTNKSAVRSADDIDSAVLSCAEVKTLATGDPRIKEKMQLDNDIYILQMSKSYFQKERIKLHNVKLNTPNQIEATQIRIENIKNDIHRLNFNKSSNFEITIGDIFYDERVEAGEHFNKLIKGNPPVGSVLGNYCGFDLIAVKPSFYESTQVLLKGDIDITVDLGESALGNVTRIEKGCERLNEMLNQSEILLITLNKTQFDTNIELAKVFPNEQELREKLQLQTKLNTEMELEQHTSVIMEEGDNEDKKEDKNTNKNNDEREI